MKKIIPIILLTTISGCSILGGYTPQISPVEVNRVSMQIPMYHPPMPDGVTMQDIKWKVLTPTIMKEYLELVEEGKAPELAYYALSPDDYKTLSYNTAEMKAYIIKVISIVEYYRDLEKEIEQLND